MFTGIVEEVGRVVALDVTPDGARLAVEAPGLAPLAKLGDSISISGCCLTVVAVDDGVRRFDAGAQTPAPPAAPAVAPSAPVPETLPPPSPGRLAVGSLVNLEDALRAGEPFGGHM